MLKVILNRLEPQAYEIIAEEQTGFRAGKRTTEEIFNIRILCEKYSQRQQKVSNDPLIIKTPYLRIQKLLKMTKFERLLSIFFLVS